MEFINDRIKDIYDGNIGKGIYQKQLISLNKSRQSDTTIKFNRNMLDKTLGEIFSEEVNTRYSNYPKNFNHNLIKRLLNEKDEKKRVFFQKLFKIKFLQCIEAFNGDDNCKDLKGFKKFSEIKGDISKDPKYIDTLANCLKNYENIFKTKKGRKGRKNVEKKENECNELKKI